MLVPLDDRPVNTDAIIKAAASAGIRLILPPKEIIATKLQTNDYGTGSESGDANAVAQWVRDNAHLADGYIFAADMLHSGGLVESRSLSPKYSVSQGTTNLGVIDTVKNSYPSKPVFVFDTVMRLASTSQYEGLDSSKYASFRSFAKQNRRVDSSSHSNVKATYDDPGSGISSFNTYGLSSTEIQNYYDARARKFDLNRVVVDKANAGKIDYVVFGVDDSSPDQNIQYSERKWLEYQNVYVIGKAKSEVIADADTVGINLMARMVKTLYGQDALRYHVEYFGSDWKTVSNVSDPYGYEHPHVTMKKQIEISGGIYEGTKSNADVSILALTPASSYRGALVNMFNSNAANSIPTAIVDMYSASGGQPDTYIVDQILAGSNGSRMIAYSGWNTMGNRMGYAIGMAGSRMNFMTYETDADKLRDASSSFASFLVDRLAEDYGYKSKRQAELQSAYSSYQTDNFNNGDSYIIPSVEADLLTKIRADQDAIERGFAGHRVIERVTYTGSLELAFFDSVPTLYDADVNLPWGRLFDVQINSSKSNLS
jgi:Protein of unknown function (DUF4127)